MNNAQVEKMPSYSAEQPRPKNPNAPFPPDDIAEAHAHDSGSVAPSRADQPYVPLRSATMWAIMLFTIAAVVALGYMVVHLHSTPTTHISGPNDRPALEQPGYKGH